MRQSATKASAPRVQSVADKSQNGDVPVADGEMAWILIDGVHVPCIMRGGKPHGPVSILEDKLLNQLSTTAAINAAFRDRRLLVSTYLTAHEALRLTYAASHQYRPFTYSDLVVDMEEFNELYTHIKSTLHKKTTVTGGWVQVNNRYVFLSLNRAIE